MASKEVKVARTGELRNGEMKQVKAGDTELLLVRQDGHFYALAAHCTHYGAPLAEGSLHGNKVVCPWHHACFDVSTGKHLNAPGCNDLPKFSVRLDGDDIYVQVPEPAPEHAVPPMSVADEGDGRVFVVLGGGAAGAYAVESMRAEGFQGRIVLVTAEDELPYDRPNCSKDFLQDNAPDEWMPLRDKAFYDRIDVELKLGSKATSVDVARKTVSLEGGEDIAYDSILICTGGKPRHLDIPGHDLKGVHYLRSLEDSRQLRDAGKSAKKVVIIGASFIGMECAFSLRELDCEVTVVTPDSLPFAKKFGEEIGKLITDTHKENGTTFKLETKPKEIKGENGKVTSVVLENGETLEADLVVGGIGVQPNTDMVKGLTLEKDGGIKTDVYAYAGRDVYAAGDIAYFPFPNGQSRIEHWQVACQMGRVAGQNMAGRRVPYKNVPFFWTAQHGLSLHYTGHADEFDEVVISGSVTDKEFLAFYIKENEVRAVMELGRTGDLAAIHHLMHERRMPEPSLIKKGVEWKQMVSSL
ncbi:FAD-dependent oxidoreductase [Roseivirga sp. BDSF3-8]|uniref:FAD-dependent oxidoreductase n=1 Tax=Roseivirga sp. BDSF3-8 TaxID=3241598 RepID=UPI003531BBCB